MSSRLKVAGGVSTVQCSQKLENTCSNNKCVYVRVVARLSQNLKSTLFQIISSSYLELLHSKIFQKTLILAFEKTVRLAQIALFSWFYSTVTGGLVDFNCHHNALCRPNQSSRRIEIGCILLKFITCKWSRWFFFKDFLIPISNI